MWWVEGRLGRLLLSVFVAAACAPKDDSQQDGGSDGSADDGGDGGDDGDGSDGSGTSGGGGPCFVDQDCFGRGEHCNTETGLCGEGDPHPDETGDPPGMSFPTMHVPFFRGQLCTTLDVLAGTQIPATISPCLHPCLEVTGGYKLHHFWDCTGSSCTAWAIWSIPAAGTGCPDDVFGQFDQSQCVYDNPLDFRLKATVRDDGTPISGTMMIEVPYLSNDDAAEIAEGSLSTSEILEKVWKYPEDPDRLVGPIDLTLASPAPPELCNGPTNCECFPVGF